MIALLAGLVLGRTGGFVPPVKPGTPAIPRIRIVPQTPGGLLQDLEESKDGTRLVTHDREFAPRLWDAKRHILLRVLDGHPDPVDNVAFDPSGVRVITRSRRRLRLWDSLRAKPLASYDAPAGDELTAAVGSPTGGTIAVGLKSGKVVLLKGDGLAPRPLGAHTKAISCLAFSPDGLRLLTAAEDKTGRVWNLKSGVTAWSLPGNRKPVAWAVFSPKGELLTTEYDHVVAGDQQTVARLWDAAGKLRATFPHVIGARGVRHTQSGAVFVGPRGEEAAAFGPDGAIEIYHPGTPKPVRRLIGHKGAIREIRESADRRYLSTVAQDDALFMWDAVAGKRLPLETGDGQYTAGEFSPTRPVFWLGFSDGEIRQFDLATGKVAKATLGSVASIDQAEISGPGPTVWLRDEFLSTGISTGTGGDSLFIDTADPSRSYFTRRYLEEETAALSPDGESVTFSSQYGKIRYGMLALFRDAFMASETKSPNGVYSPDGKRILALDGPEGSVDLYSGTDFHYLKGWKWPLDAKNQELQGAVWHPNGTWSVTFGHPGDKALLWDTDSGQILKDLGAHPDRFLQGFVTLDGKLLVVRAQASLYAVDLETGQTLWTKNAADASDGKAISASADGKRFVLRTRDRAIVFDTATGVEIFRATAAAPPLETATIGADGRQLATADNTEVTVWDLATKKPVCKLNHAGEVKMVRFAQDSRIVTCDGVGGLHVWNLAGKRLATLVMMRDGDWLVYDDDGRFDAKDPSDVKGAYFVLEWDGGLEPIAMPQLKGQFYEPHLLAKALGRDPEPLRDVPNLENLRLFPTLDVKSVGNGVYSVSAKERDEGGIGTVRVSINGKEVLRKKGAGYFKFDSAQYTNYLLPEVRLAGSKNVLAVTVSNESGEPVSPPETVTLTTPAGLQVPDVHLYALCVGIGDYAGKGGDLQAPPSDAAAIGRAVRETAERLLPGHVDVDVLTTASGPKPTRAAILGWLRQTAAKATSSDIVFVFAAGHGMSHIGDQSGYFLLTSEADPTDVEPSAARTVTISGEELRQSLSAIPAGKQVVVLDTCHSGAAASSLVETGRSVSGEYQRAWEAIKDTTGVWLLAGAAADQLSYESSNVDHGMLTYALLEAIDKASADGLRKAPSGELFLDVERWLGYAANRVESLKAEVGISGVQRPEFKRATRGETFDLGVMDEKRRGFLDLRPPLPVVIVGDFQKDEEDPAGLEDAVTAAMKDAKAVKPWFDVAKHPNVYRVTGTYTLEGDALKLHVLLQRFDDRQQRRTIDTFDLAGSKDRLFDLAGKVRTEVENRIRVLEAAKAGRPSPVP